MSNFLELPVLSLTTSEKKNLSVSSTSTGTVMCPYCGVGCHVDVTADRANNCVTQVVGTKSSPTNHGQLCPKGALLAPVLTLPGRLSRPLMRNHWNEPQRPTTWTTALDEAAMRLSTIIQKYGADSVALYGSGQLDTEAWYVGNKLFKGFIGSNNVDSNSRLCMASAVAGYLTTLGSDGPPTCYDDIEEADVFLVIGSNMADTHPVTFQRIKAFCGANKGNTTLIVVDPRFTHTAKAANIHVQLQPGSDIAFCHALAKIILARHAADDSFISQHTNGFADYVAMLDELLLDDLVRICRVPLEMIERVAEKIAGAKGFLSLYCMGLGQSTVGTAKCQALIDLHLLTGHIGKPGSGPFSLTGQPNAMGGRELGGLAQLLPGYRFIENAEHRHEVETAWGVQHGRIQPKVGLTAIEIFEGLERGQIKALWVVCNNAMVSLPNLDQVRRALYKAELLITQDCFETETTNQADFVFPAAQWAEKAGTMTSSERRVSRNPQLVQPFGESKPDWWIFCEMAKRLGYHAFNYDSNEAIWEEFRLLTRGRPCDMSGMTNARLREGSLQWPCPHENHPGTARRYLDQQFATPNGKANFVAAKHMPPREMPSPEFPLLLTTGRLASQWHTMTRTGKVDKLKNQAIEAFIELHPDDAQAHGVNEGDVVIVQSVRGESKVQVKLNPRSLQGVVFMPFHWGGIFAPGGEANNVTSNAFDPISKQPEYKACAVRLVHTGLSLQKQL